MFNGWWFSHHDRRKNTLQAKEVFLNFIRSVLLQAQIQQRMFSPAGVNFEKLWQKEKLFVSGACYLKNNAGHANAGRYSIMKKSYVQLDEFGWIWVVCRPSSPLLVRRQESKEFDPSFKQSHVRELRWTLLFRTWLWVCYESFICGVLQLEGQRNWNNTLKFFSGLFS